MQSQHGLVGIDELSGYAFLMKSSSGSSLADLASFLKRLEHGRIHFTLSSVREGAVMVKVSVPGERWEIEFFPDRPIEVEIFGSDGTIGDATLFTRLFT